VLYLRHKCGLKVAEYSYLSTQMDIELLIKFGIFFLIGAITFVIDAGAAFFMLRKLKWPLLLANSIGFLMGKAVNFFANRQYTFHSHDPNIVKQALIFTGIVLSGLVVVNVIVKYLHHNKQWRFFPAKLVAMVIFMTYNFFANNYLTFAR